MDPLGINQGLAKSGVDMNVNRHLSGDLEDRGSLSQLCQALGGHNNWLVVTGTYGWIMTFHSVGNGIIIPTDEVIFFRGVGEKPPTRSDIISKSNE